MVKYFDFIHMIISVLFTGIQEEKKKRSTLFHKNSFVSYVYRGRDGREGSELAPTPSCLTMHAVKVSERQQVTRSRQELAMPSEGKCRFKYFFDMQIISPLLDLRQLV